MNGQPIERRSLLSASLPDLGRIEHLEAEEITLPPYRRAGLHTHPCPVVGTITAGRILFQIEGGPARVLAAGSAFFEPAGARVLHFDNLLNEPARFVAFYLLGAERSERITMLPENGASSPGA